MHWPERWQQGDAHLHELVRCVPGATVVRANRLTGNILICFDERQVDAGSVLAAVHALAARTTPPAEGDPAEDDPAKGLPADPPPPARTSDTEALAESAAVLAAAVAGLVVVAVRRGIRRAPAAHPGAALVAAVIGLVRDGRALRRAAGHRPSAPEPVEVALELAALGALAYSGSMLGLAVGAATNLRRLTSAQATRSAWQGYLRRLEIQAGVALGRRIAVRDGGRAAGRARILDGAGTTVGRDGLPVPVRSGVEVPAGARLWGGTFTLELQDEPPWPRPRRITAAPPTLDERYDMLIAPLAVVGAVGAGVASRRRAAAGAWLMVVDPRPALVGADAAELGAWARLVRLGLTPVPGARRRLQLPGVVLVDCARALCDGLEVGTVTSRTLPEGEALRIGLALADEAGMPWGPVAAAVEPGDAKEASFDGAAVEGVVRGTTYRLAPAPRGDGPAARLRAGGEYPLRLAEASSGRQLALIGLCPRLDPGVEQLVSTCRRCGVELLLAAGADEAPSARRLASLAGIELAADGEAERAARRLQAGGAIVAAVVDTPEPDGLLAAADLSIALTTGRTSRFAAHVDLFAPDLRAVAGAVETLQLLAQAERDAVLLAASECVAGGLLMTRRRPEMTRSAASLNLATLAAVGAGAVRLRGGEAARSSLLRIRDPRPERWGRETVEGVLRALRARERGLSLREAASRRRAVARRTAGNAFVRAVGEQLRSPLVAVLAVGAGLSLLAGSLLDVGLIAAVVAANAVLGAAEESHVGRAVAALEDLTRPTARVLRGGRRMTVPAHEIVPGDVLLLAHGDRIVADARVITAYGLQVDEASLTGESFPVRKAADGGSDASRVVLDGSDVTVGHGRAVAFAVGPDTRLGTLAEALEEKAPESPLGLRLGRMVREVLPAVTVGAVLVVATGLVRRRPLAGQLVLGASVAVAAVPEGLPLLAGMGQASVGRRLATRNALVRRLSAVEALGRVDVVCVDKTGTLTEGRLRVRIVASPTREAPPSPDLPDELRPILLDGAFACPRPSSSSAGAHPTDVAVLEAARLARLDDGLTSRRGAEAPFDPARPFHAVIARGALRAKGSPEALLGRCDAVRDEGRDRPLDDAGRAQLLARAADLGERGLRVLAVAEGPARSSPEDPRGLVLVGFLGLGDTLRPGVHGAVMRCRAAGVRPIMLTGDHPATARAIAAEIGLPAGVDGVVSGEAITALADDELDAQLERASVIARIAPLDKLRVVQSLQRRGHAVAMTGDGVNDAPALRLADVGVAMGRSGSEVARQAADVVLADDNFASLVEALVEGRSFWANARRALGILLGGNLGEVAFIVVASVLGSEAPLTARQVLAVNLASDVLPVFPLASQEPRERDLSALAREGGASLGAPLRREIVRRAVATALPTYAAFVAARRAAGPEVAQVVGFGAIIATQLAQSAAVGLADAGPASPVLPAIGATALMVAAATTLAPLRRTLALAAPTPFAAALIAGAAAGALVVDAALARRH
ncbi:MAG TPA: HAD-IC family P-type ATPase [Gaiellaceae bacterium]|nr:HAD-IC family P-type ATPase [Gaiellaceae bacterium]